MAAASKARLRNGFGGATTAGPAACSSRITPPKPDASAKAPWTRTTVGAGDVVISATLSQPTSGYVPATQDGSAIGGGPSPIRVRNFGGKAAGATVNDPHLNR